LLNKILFFKTQISIAILPRTLFPPHTSVNRPLVLTDHWHIMVLTVFRYSRSQIRIKIDLKVQTWV